MFILVKSDLENRCSYSTLISAENNLGKLFLELVLQKRKKNA